MNILVETVVPTNLQENAAAPKETPFAIPNGRKFTTSQFENAQLAILQMCKDKALFQNFPELPIEIQQRIDTTPSPQIVQGIPLVEQQKKRDENRLRALELVEDVYNTHDAVVAADTEGFMKDQFGSFHAVAQVLFTDIMGNYVPVKDKTNSNVPPRLLDRMKQKVEPKKKKKSH